LVLHNFCRRSTEIYVVKACQFHTAAMCLIDHVGIIPSISRYHVQQQQQMLQQKLKIQVWPTTEAFLFIKAVSAELRTNKSVHN